MVLTSSRVLFLGEVILAENLASHINSILNKREVKQKRF